MNDYVQDKAVTVTIPTWAGLKAMDVSTVHDLGREYRHGCPHTHPSCMVFFLAPPVASDSQPFCLSELQIACLPALVFGTTVSLASRSQFGRRRAVIGRQLAQSFVSEQQATSEQVFCVLRPHYRTNACAHLRRRHHPSKTNMTTQPCSVRVPLTA